MPRVNNRTARQRNERQRFLQKRDEEKKKEERQRKQTTVQESKPVRQEPQRTVRPAQVQQRQYNERSRQTQTQTQTQMRRQPAVQQTQHKRYTPSRSGRGDEYRGTGSGNFLRNAGYVAKKATTEVKENWMQTGRDLNRLAMGSSKNDADVMSYAMKLGLNPNDKRDLEKARETLKHQEDEANKKLMAKVERQNKRQKKFKQMTKDASGLEKAFYGAEDSGIGMAADLTMGALAGLATGGVGSGAVALGAIGARSYGQERGQAKAEGATEREDVTNALIHGGIEMVTERIFRGAGFAKKYAGKGSLALSDYVSNAITKNLKGKAANAVGSAARLATGMGEEVAEEVLAWAADPIASEVAYQGNLRKRKSNKMKSRLQDYSDSIRSQIKDEQTARSVATYLNSDEFMEDNKKEYMNIGLSEKKSTAMAEHLRDYLTASLTGDTDEMERLENKMAESINGKGPTWSTNELKETVAATALLTGVTGMPGTVRSSMSGAKLKKDVGEEGLKDIVKLALDFDDAAESEKAKAMLKRMESGKEITNTQAYDLQQAVIRQAEKNAYRVDASRNTAMQTISSEGLVVPFAEEPGGRLSLGTEASRRFDRYTSDAKSVVKSVNEAYKDDSMMHLNSKDANDVAGAIAAFQSGIMGIDDADAFTWNNEVAREAFSQVTGIDLEQFAVRNRKGEINVPKTNASIRDNLFALASENLVETARAETANWIDHTSGEIVTNATRRMGAKGSRAIQDVLDNVDVRDANKYAYYTNAADYLYQAGRNTGMKWEDGIDKEAARMFPTIPEDVRFAMYDAGLQDREAAADTAVRRQVEIGKSVSEMGEQPAPTGQVFWEATETAPVESVHRAFTEIAQAVGVDIHLVDHIKVKTEDGQEGEANGAYNPKTNSFVINISSAPEQNVGYIFMHEFTHYLKMNAPEQYHELETLVRDKWFKYSPEQMQAAIARRIDAYSGQQVLTEEQALEEIICDACHDFLNDENFANQVAAENPSLAKAMIDSIKNLLRKLREIFAGNKIQDETAMNSLFTELDILTEAEALWMEAYKQAVRNQGNQAIEEMQERTVRNSISEKDQTRYSIFGTSKDSKGNKLSPGQKSFFRNSKALDRQGRLAAVYHTTKNGGFTIFDPEESDDKRSLFFSSSFGVSQTYAKNADKRISHEPINFNTWEDFEKHALDNMSSVVPGNPVSDLLVTVYKGSDKAYDLGYNRHAQFRSWARQANGNAMASKGYHVEMISPYSGEMVSAKTMPELLKKLSEESTERMTWSQKGYYECYLDLEDPLIIEGNGASWTTIPFRNSTYNTRQIAEIAEKEGYDGVIIRDIEDTDNVNQLEGDAVSDIYIAFSSEQVKSTDNLNPTEDKDYRYSISSEQRSELNDVGVEELEDGTTARYSVPSWNKTNKEKKLKALVEAGHNERTAKKWINDINSIAAIILSDTDRLDYLADPNEKFLKDNGDYYKKTLDASTLCDKRRYYQGTYDAIQHALPNSPLLEQDVIRIRSLLKERGYVAPCGICYVESQRKKLGTYAKEWYDNYERKDEIRLEDVTTTDGLAELKKTNPEVAADFVKAMGAKGVQSPKVVELRTDYREEIMRMKEATVEYLNKIGGLRFHSFSDFESVNLIDTMQAIMDMATKNLMGMAYTKVPNFVAVFGGTGIKINLSLIVRTDENGNVIHDEDGNIVFDTEEGISYEEAKKWRDEYPDNVAFIAVGKDMENTMELLNDERVDYVIPFHKSKWSNEDLKKLGLKGYVDFATGHQDNKVFVSEYWNYNKSGKENAETYLKKCAERGVKPVFEQLLVDNGDGSYSLQPDGSTDNYWKLLVEGKMYNHKTGKGVKQKPVKPKFNMEEARRVLNEYEGGADTLPVANDVVDAFVTEYLKNHPEAKTNDVRLSISAKYDEPYMKAVESGDMDAAQKYVDEAAKAAGMRPMHMYHGSMNADFTVFDKRYAKVGGNSGAGFYFSTSKSDSLDHYQDVEGADNYFKWSELAERILVDGFWGDEEVDDLERATEIAKEYYNKSPGTFDVYLNYKTPYVRDYRNSTNLYDKIMEDYDESVIDREDYDSEDDYQDALWESRVEHVNEAIYNAVRGADIDLNDNYEFLEGPSLYDIVNGLVELALDYESLTWSDIESTLDRLGTTDVTNDGWGIDQTADASPEFTRAIIENLGFDAIVDKEVSSKFGQLSREMQTDTEHVIVFKPEQIKLSDPVTYADDGSVIPLSERFDPNNNDIRYSMPTQDSDGKILSDGQMEFFKESQARNGEGRLVPVYHTTARGGFTVFDPWYSNDNRSLFFTSNLNMSKSYLRGKKGTMINPYGDDSSAVYTYDSVYDLPEFTSAEVEQRVRDNIKNIRVVNTETGEEFASGDDFVEIAVKMLGHMEDEGYEDASVAVDLENSTENEMGAAWEVFSNATNFGLEYTFDFPEDSFRGTYSCYLNLKNPLIVDGKGSYWNFIGYEEKGRQKKFRDIRMDLIPEWGEDETGEPIVLSYDFILEYSRKDDDGWNKGRAKETIQNPDTSNSMWLPEEEVLSILRKHELSHDALEELFENENPMDGGYEYEVEGEIMFDSYSYYTTRELAQIAQENGNDGVIFRNIIDYGGHGYGWEPADVYVVFESNQIKDINNENPTDDPDIRYSMTPMDEALNWLASQYDLEDIPSEDEVEEEGRVRMAKSKEEYFQSRNLLWNERWLTEGKVLKESSVEKNIRQLVMGVMKNSDTDHKYKAGLVDKLVNDAVSAYRMLKDGKAMDAEKLLWDSAIGMVENVDFIDDSTFEQYKRLRDYLRDTHFKLGEEYWHDVDYQEFRKRNLNRIKMVRGDTNIDSLYKELQEQWPEWFDEGEQLSVPDQLLHIEQVLDGIKPYKYAYTSEEAADLAYDIASELWVIIYEGKEYSSIADTYKERYDKKVKAMKARHAEALRKVKEKGDLRVLKEKAKFKEYKEKEKNNREKVKRFGSIQKNIDWLSERLVHETKDKNIPESFRKSLAHLLMHFDMQTQRSKKLEAKYGMSKKTLELHELRDRYKEIASEDDTGEFNYNGYLFYMMDALVKKVDGQTIDALDVEDMIVIDTMLKAIRHNFMNYNKVWKEGKQVEIASIGDKTIEVMENRIGKYGQRRTYKGAMGFVYNVLNEGEETPIYFFERIDPTGEGIGAMYKELRRGEDKHIRNMDFLRNTFREMFGGYDNRGKLKNGSRLEKWRDSSKSQTFELENGTVTMNPAQIMSLYCLTKRPQAMGHILGSGIVVAPVSIGQKIREKITGTKEQVQAVRVSYAEVQKIVSSLTDEQKQLADKMQALLNNEMAAWGNETSLKLYGIKTFREKNYFPIQSSDTQIKKDANKISVQEKIKNLGFTKPLVQNANNAIMIDDIFSVVADHCNKMSLYNAIAVPMTDFMRVYNYNRRVDGEDSRTVQEMIGQAFSKRANKYILDFIDDVNGNTKTRSDAVDDLFNHSLANYKRASIGANLRVALQQPTAFFRAAMVISPKYLLGVKPTPTAMKEMFEHCPIALWKSWGHYEMDLGKDVEDIMMNTDWSAFEVATMGLYGALDNVTWCMIWQAVKKEVEAKNPGVKVGSEEYWRLCNERASEVFDKTQVVDSIFHRSDTMRSKNTLTKMAVSFMAEPTLTYNVFRDSLVKSIELMRDGEYAEAFKLFSRMVGVIALNAAAVSAAAAVWDAVRGKSDDDDDDDKKFAELWYENFLNNLKDNANLINNIYYVKNIKDIADGWGSSNMALEGWVTLFKGKDQAKKKLEKGEDYINPSTGKPITWYDISMNILGGAGYITGYPVKTIMRDARAIIQKLGIPVFADDGSIAPVEEKANDLAGAIRKYLPDFDKSKSDKGDGEEDTKTTLAKMESRAAEKAKETDEDSLDDVLWDTVSDGYTKHIEDVDFKYINEIKKIYVDNGGDGDKFDAKILKQCPSAYKKLLKDDMTDEDIRKQAIMKSYMLDNGMTPEQLSQICYKTYTARDLKAALRIGRDDLVIEELSKLVRAGLTFDDFRKLVKYQNSGANTYDGKYSGPEYALSTGSYVWPTQGQITSGFGYRDAPTAGASTNHPAIDIGASEGSPVVAADGGKVISAGTKRGYGNQVAIKHDDGTVTYYSHLYSWDVRKGDVVRQGQPIGQVGSTGTSTGPHLDFRVEVNGEPVNPLTYLK